MEDVGLSDRMPSLRRNRPNGTDKDGCGKSVVWGQAEEAMSLATNAKPKGNRDYPVCECGQPATVFTPNGESLCKRCAKLRAIKRPKGGRK